MTSEKKILANRANGAKSRGPITPEGKARSARNAIRHGLLSRQLLLANENPEDFQDLLHDYVEEFQPQGGVEMQYVEAMAVASWKLARAESIEIEGIRRAIDLRPRTGNPESLAVSFLMLAENPGFTLIQRYQARLHLIHSRLLRDLHRLRRTRPDGAIVDVPVEVVPEDCPENGSPVLPNDPISVLP